MTLLANKRKMLHVDLTTGHIDKELIDEGTVMKFIGGSGINNKLGYDLIKRGVDPLSPQNVIIFGAGLLGGTIIPGSSKVMATTKLPATKAIGTCYGSSASDALNYTGYSHVIVTGKAEKPVFLKIFDDDVELCDAKELWGKDAYDTTDELLRRYGDQCSAISIGPAGENLLALSLAWINKASHLGRGGLAAVMGSKNLKALLLYGTKGLEVADRNTLVEIADYMTDCEMKLPVRPGWIYMGAAQRWWGEDAAARGRIPAPDGPFGGAYGYEEYKKIWRGTWACPSCPSGCKLMVQLLEGEYAGDVVSFENFLHFMPMWKEFNPGSLHRVLELMNLCDRYGMDHISVCHVVDFAVTLYENNILSKEETDGMELKRDYHTIKELIYKMVRREGLGGLLADGIGQAVNKIGRGSQKYAITIKGMEPFGVLLDKIFDPREFLNTPFLAQLVRPRGPQIASGQGPGIVPGRPVRSFEAHLRRMMVSEDIIARICTESSVNFGRLLRYNERWYETLNILGVCARQPHTQCFRVPDVPRLVAAVTGLDIDLGEFSRAADRSWNILKAANVREGFTRKDDEIPEGLFEPIMIEGTMRGFSDYFGNPLTKADAGQLLSDYYEERGWDTETGIPTKETLLALQLDNVVKDLEVLGISMGVDRGGCS